METIEVRSLKPEEFKLWDTLAEVSPYGTVFHKTSWIHSASCESGVNTNIFGAFSHDHLVGGCAVHYRKIGQFFTYATTSIPLTPYGGVLIQPQESSKIRDREMTEGRIINALLSAIWRKKPISISLTMSPNVIDIRPYTWQGWDPFVKYCYLYPLSSNISDRISKKVRWSINKAKKAGIKVKRKWDKDLYWDLTVATYRKQGTDSPISKRMLFSLMDIINDNRWGEMWIAETPSGEVAAAEITTWDHQMAYRWSAASDERFKETGATSYLLMDIMTHLEEKNFTQFNMMAANMPNLAKFVSGFNPVLIPYYSVRKTRFFVLKPFLHG